MKIKPEKRASTKTTTDPGHVLRFGSTCPNPDGHEGHMQMNGECPWCGAYDESQIVDEAEWSFQDADTVREIEQFG